MTTDEPAPSPLPRRVPWPQHLAPDEAAAMARFLVEVAALEAQLTDLIVEYFETGKPDEFVSTFVSKLTLGRKLEALKPAVRAGWLPGGAAVLDALREVVALRNLVAHGRPTMDYVLDGDGPDSDISPFMVYYDDRKALRASALADEATKIETIRDVLAGVLPATALPVRSRVHPARPARHPDST